MIPTIDNFNRPVASRLACLAAIFCAAAITSLTGCRMTGVGVSKEPRFVSATLESREQGRIRFAPPAEAPRTADRRELSAMAKSRPEETGKRLRNVSFQDDESAAGRISTAGELTDSAQRSIQPAPISMDGQTEPEVRRLPVMGASELAYGTSRIENSVSPVQLTLSAYESLVLSNQPAIDEAAARVEALRGKHLQAGLGPNPTVGLNGEDIGEDGGDGRYGVYFGRRIVRGGKLGRAQSVVCAELEVAEQRLQAARQRVLTDARMRFYDLLVAQKKLEIAEQLSRLSIQAVEASEKLYNASEIARTTVLQSELEAQQTVVIERQAENQLLGARRRLATLVGQSDLIQSVASGGIEDVLLAVDFESSFEQLMESSPELAELYAGVERARRQLEREQVQAIPDVTWQATLQYDTVGDNVISGFQVGMPVPIFDRNQGAIYQAQQQIQVTEQQVLKKTLDLRNRLAMTFQTYRDAKLQVNAFENEILPKAAETLKLVSTGYQQGEVNFLQLLTTQRTYFQTNMTYMDQLQRLLQKHAEISGMLLSNGLR